MTVLFFLIFLLAVGGIVHIGESYVKLIPTKVNENNAQALVEKIDTLYRDYFYRDDELFKGKTLQEFCSEYNLKCYDQRGLWRWELEERGSPSNLFTYYVIHIYDKAGREIGRVSGEKYWSDYLRQIELNQAQICKALIDYYRDMLRVYSYPLNWYAKNGIYCRYDYGQDGLDFGGKKVEKEFECSEGWTELRNADGNLGKITGGTFKFPTGRVEYDNANEIYSLGFPCYGATDINGQPLTGNSPPYAVAFRVWIKTGYYSVCCGY